MRLLGTVFFVSAAIGIWGYSTNPLDAADNPKFKQGMGLRDAQRLVREAGWMARTQSWCRLGSGQRIADCGNGFSNRFIAQVPELSGTAASRPWLYLCYPDGYGKTLTLTF